MLSSILRAFGVKNEQPKDLDGKMDAVLSIVGEVRDELKPLGPDGSRVSRLEMMLSTISQLAPGDRDIVRQELDSLEVDEQILEFSDKPKNIEEIAKKIGRSYGYTANRLRKLMRLGRVMRKRDAVTRKYVYMRL
ncbi:MAG: hypothetical protein GOU99_00915 [Candidatus Altiarchaeota archaeon]|nr:hypothetical protein [Candidatus Altiarchaeota archaeon]